MSTDARVGAAHLLLLDVCANIVGVWVALVITDRS